MWQKYKHEILVGLIGAVVLATLQLIFNTPNDWKTNVVMFLHICWGGMLADARRWDKERVDKT